MARAAQHYVCQDCGAVSRRWSGRCGACGEWNTIIEESTPEVVPKGLGAGKGRKIALQPLDVPEGDEPSRRVTGLGELDRVVGGGLVPGTAVLIGGDPGIGKSTLLLQAVAALAQRGVRCAYISGEEATAQIRMRARRLGEESAPVELAAATNVRDIVEMLNGEGAPRVVVIDSIQTMYVDALESAPGTVAQVRSSTQELIRIAKRRDITLLLVGHVTKDGQIAGPRVLEHMVDTVLYFEGERGHQYRIMRARQEPLRPDGRDRCLRDERRGPDGGRQPVLPLPRPA